MNWKDRVKKSGGNPVQVFLKTYKTDFVERVKEKQDNIIHDLDNFLIVDIWYTLKWNVFDKTANKFTASYTSNEIKDWNEPLYVVKHTFLSSWSVSDLVLKWYRTTDIKENIKWKASLHLAITILDLNDWMLKEIFLSWKNFWTAMDFLKEADPNEVCSIKWVMEFENTETKERISEEELNKLKWIEAQKYSARYMFNITWTWVQATEEQKDEVRKKNDEILAFLPWNREFYKNKYWEVWKQQEYAKPEEEVKEVEIVQPVAQNTQQTKQVQQSPVQKTAEEVMQEVGDDIGIEDIPF